MVMTLPLGEMNFLLILRLTYVPKIITYLMFTVINLAGEKLWSSGILNMFFICSLTSPFIQDFNSDIFGTIEAAILFINASCSQ